LDEVHPALRKRFEQQNSASPHAAGAKRAVLAEVSELVRDLLRPEAFGAEAGVAVALRTTHASWVFLVGDEAWKLKRPVDLGFLDFRTVEARRHDCEEEVRLNRRLAPDVYLAVEPVHRTPAGLKVGAADGPIVDWAVRMRRLPDEASAEAMLARGALDAAALARLAAHAARFLAEARAVPALGAPEILRASVEENFAQVAPFLGELLDQATWDEARAFQLGQLTTGAERFGARAREGRIREGHGDLRLEHVYFLPPAGGGSGGEEIAIIDCIEFNERFRCGDAAGEAAFLAMELESAGRFDLADGFVARFAEASDDFGLYGVLDFYLSYRAWVRGKVAAFVAADVGTPPELRARKRQEARRDFALARSCAGTALDPPFLIAVGGPPGSGKSTLAGGLGRVLAAPVVASDRVRKALGGIAATTRGGADLYRPEMNERTYREMFGRARRVVESGRGVLLDATFSTPASRAAAAELARACGVRFAFIEARCSAVETLRARLAAREAGPSVSDATEALLEPLLRRYQPLGPGDPQPALTIDTVAPPAVVVAAALDQLRRVGLETSGAATCP
jgi:aminoglycoside phosphotransferase family enzyme/predicted kinase